MYVCKGQAHTRGLIALVCSVLLQTVLYQGRKTGGSEAKEDVEEDGCSRRKACKALVQV